MVICHDNHNLYYLHNIQVKSSNWAHVFPKIFCKATVKPVLSGHSKIDKKKVFMANGSLTKVESIAECSPWSILQYFWPALSNNWSWKQIFVFFFSGRLRQVLLYKHYVNSICIP